MTQNSPGWLSFLGISSTLTMVGIIGTCIAYSIKSHIDLLNSSNTTLKDEIDRLRLTIETQEKRANELYDTYLKEFYRTLNNVKLSKTNSDDQAVIEKILSKFQELKSEHEKLKDYKIAATWLNEHKIPLVNRAFNCTIKTHSKIIPGHERKKFKQEITAIFDWLYQSLYRYGHARMPLKGFASNPKINSSSPYVTAIQSIIDNKNRNNLSVEQSIILDAMMKQLINKIKKSFKD